jgi:hypothetical protein
MVPLADDLAKLQLLLLQLRPCRRRLCPRRRCLRLQLITEQSKVRHLGAPLGEAFISLDKRDLLGPQQTQTPLSRWMNNDLAVLISASF